MVSGYRIAMTCRVVLDVWVSCVVVGSQLSRRCVRRRPPSTDISFIFPPQFSLIFCFWSTLKMAPFDCFVPLCPYHLDLPVYSTDSLFFIEVLRVLVPTWCVIDGDGSWLCICVWIIGRCWAKADVPKVTELEYYYWQADVRVVQRVTARY